MRLPVVEIESMPSPDGGFRCRYCRAKQGLILVSLAMIVSPFGFFEVQMEGVSKGRPLNFASLTLRQSPQKPSMPLIVDGSLGKLVLTMIDADVAMKVPRSTRPL